MKEPRNQIIIGLRYCHKPYIAIEKVGVNDALEVEYKTIAGSQNKNYLMKKYDIVCDVLSHRILKGEDKMWLSIAPVVIAECIKLLKIDGQDTKQQVLEKLEELVK